MKTQKVHQKFIKSENYFINALDNLPNMVMHCHENLNKYNIKIYIFRNVGKIF